VNKNQRLKEIVNILRRRNVVNIKELTQKLSASEGRFPVRIAGVQMDVAIGDLEKNLARILSFLDTAAQAGARIIVFPECALSGYCFDSLEEARVFGQPIPGPSVERIARMCREREVHAVYGLLEIAGPLLFNSCVLIGPHGLAGSYRKIHLPFLGVDRFTTPGDRPFAVHQADTVRIGLNICYDGSFPETARVMALDGADLIAQPTNYVTGSECMTEHGINIRAMENNVYYIMVNRVGDERGFRFIGSSRICGPGGRTMAVAPADGETILYAEIDPAEARRKRLVRMPGKHEIDRIADRRPRMYRRLVQ
jgi:predicted amidohydrolase